MFRNLNAGFFLRRNEVGFPLVGIHIGPLACANSEGVFYLLVERIAFVALFHIIEGKAVGQGFSGQEVAGIQVYAPLLGNVGGAGEQVGAVANGIVASVEGADDIDFIVCARGLRKDGFHQDAVRAGLEGLLFVVILNFQLGRAGCCKDQDTYVCKNSFHNYLEAT